MTRDFSYEEQALPQSHALHTTPSPSPGCHLSVQQLHLINHHAPLEDRHEVRRLLAHCDPDLHWLVVVLLVQHDGLISRGCNLILAGLAALE